MTYAEKASAGPARRLASSWRFGIGTEDVILLNFCQSKFKREDLDLLHLLPDPMTLCLKGEKKKIFLASFPIFFFSKRFVKSLGTRNPNILFFYDPSER